MTAGLRLGDICASGCHAQSKIGAPSSVLDNSWAETVVPLLRMVVSAGRVAVPDPGPLCPGQKLCACPHSGVSRTGVVVPF